MNSNVSREKNIVLSGLNQIYSSTIEEISSFDQINTIFVNNLSISSKLSQKSPEVIKNIIQKFISDYNLKDFDIGKFSLDFENYIRENVKIHEYNIKDILKLNNFFSIDKTYYQSFLDQSIQITITNGNLLFLYFEYVILGYFNLATILLFKLENEVMSHISKSPKSYIVLSHDIEYLYNFHKLNCWTIFLASFVYNTNFDKKEYCLNVLNEKNKSFIRKNGKFFCMAAGNIIQIEYYISEIFNISKNSTESNIQKLNHALNNLINQHDPIRVFYLHMIIFKKNELQKAHHYKSTNKILFLPYFGFDGYEEINLNADDFDLILLKFSTRQEYEFLQTLQKSLIRFTDEKTSKKGKKIQFINSLKPMESFYHRVPMSIYLDNFCKSENLTKINETFKTRTLFPGYHAVTLAEVNEEEKFLKFVKDKKMQLPIIIKHSGPVEFGHLLACVISNEGLKNYHSYIKSAFSSYRNEDLDLVIQNFNNHGGYFIKLFYIDDKAYSYFRPSIPNLHENLKNTEERFEKGFYPFITDDLLTSQYLEFW